MVSCLQNLPLTGRVGDEPSAVDDGIDSVREDGRTGRSEFPVQTAGGVGVHRTNQGLQTSRQRLYVVAESRDSSV